MTTYYALLHKASMKYLDNEGGSPILCSNKTYFEEWMADTERWKSFGFYKPEDYESTERPIKFVLADPSEMEIVEWIPCNPFIFAIPIDCQYELDGSAVVSTIQIPQHKIVEDEQGCPIAAKDENEDYIYEQVRVLLINLNTGFVNFGWSTLNDEGYSYEYYAVELGEDELGQPVWLIEMQTGGRDCDGPIEHYRYYKSKGGKKKNFEEYLSRMLPSHQPLTDEEKELYLSELRLEYAIEEYRSEFQLSNHNKGYNRDRFAEAMGY
jgi:hypothetical protein